MILYGIPTCDSCRKLRRRLDEEARPHDFHDLRADGLPEARLDAWLSALGWEALLNRRGTTWRRLPAERREPLDATRARALMLAHPLLVKRPVVELDDQVYVGLGAALDQALEAG